MQAQHADEKSSYRPLIAVISIILFSSAALQVSNGQFNSMLFMNQVMGLFFLIFAMFKFFDLDGFADGFQMYDVVAKKFRGYAYAYPFVELILGFLFLSGQCLFLSNLFTLIIMSVSTAGVFISMRRGYKFKCACLGTILNIPLSTVSLLENVSMGLMAAYMLLYTMH
jgi:hypothetical protein